MSAVLQGRDQICYNGISLTNQSDQIRSRGLCQPISSEPQPPKLATEKNGSCSASSAENSRSTVPMHWALSQNLAIAGNSRAAARYSVGSLYDPRLYRGGYSLVRTRLYAGKADLQGRYGEIAEISGNVHSHIGQYRSDSGPSEEISLSLTTGNFCVTSRDPVSPNEPRPVVYALNCQSSRKTSGGACHGSPKERPNNSGRKE